MEKLRIAVLGGGALGLTAAYRLASRGAQVTVLELQVHPEDLGKVIGRQGRTAKAIRTVLGAAGIKARKRYTLEILED